MELFASITASQAQERHGAKLSPTLVMDLGPSPGADLMVGVQARQSSLRCPNPLHGEHRTQGLTPV